MEGKEKHAEVTIGEYTIPLIGLPREVTLEKCDLCYNIVSIQKITITKNGQFLCFECKERNRSQQPLSLYGRGEATK